MKNMFKVVKEVAVAVKDGVIANPVLTVVGIAAGAGVVVGVGECMRHVKAKKVLDKRQRLVEKHHARQAKIAAASATEETAEVSE